MLKLHPSRVFSIYLIIFLFATALFSVKTINYNFSKIIIALIIIIIIFFFKERRIRYISLVLFVILLANQRVYLTNIKEQKINNQYVKSQIVDEPRIFGKSQSFTINAGKNNYNIVTSQFPEYEFGDNLIIVGDIETLDSSNEYYRYYISRNIQGSYYYPKIKKINGKKSILTLLRRRLIGIRKKYEDIISKTLSEPQAGLLSGILLGSRADLSEKLSELLSKTGVIHIVALSGYNITIISAFMTLIGRGFSKKYVFWFSTVGIWAFVFATGLSPSVVRAAIMGTLLLVASNFGRKSSATISILFASVLMVYLNPNILLYNIGFQLSFAAVCGILFLAPIIEKLLKFENKFWSSMIIATLSAQLFTTPLISYYFERISLISPVTNLFILPFVPIVMLLGFVSSSVGLLSLWLSLKLSIINWALLSYFVKVVEFLGYFKYSEIHYSMSAITLVGIYLIIFEIIIILNMKINEKRKNY